MPKTPAPQVCLFWDNSNIFISAKSYADERDGLYGGSRVRLHFEKLYKLAAAGRKVVRAHCVGSVPPELGDVWNQMKAATGVVPELYERGTASGKEQGIDQCLQVWMLRAGLDITPPAVAVLLTGDGAGYHDGAGFHADLERLYNQGWGIEVLSWDRSCAGKLRTWASTIGTYIKLEDYFEAITFQEDGRQSKALNLAGRATSSPRGITTQIAT